MNYQRMVIEKEAPEEVGAIIKYNLSESAISDQTLDSLQISIPPDIVLTYTEHQGSQKLRDLIARTSNGVLSANDVLVTAGASTSLFIITTALLGPKDHLVVSRPNYATNLEIPRSIGCDITFVDLEFQSQFRMDVDRIAAAIRPGSTKLISVCSPNNPTGAKCSVREMRALASLSREHGCYLLVDETYKDLDHAAFQKQPVEEVPYSACLGDQVISVSSMSKAYGVPGIRVGWLISTDQGLQEAFLAGKEQISISGSVIDELVAEQILSRRNEILSQTVAEMRRRRDLVAGWVEENSALVEWVKPEAGVMCLIRLKNTPAAGALAFYDKLLREQGVYVGRGGWFEMDDLHFRLGYGWPTWEDLKTGLEILIESLRQALP